MICIPVVATTNEEAVEQMDRCFPLADVVELRIDFIRNANLGKLLSAKTGKILVTARKKSEGGHFEGDEEGRLSLLREAVTLRADFIDIELSTDETFTRKLLENIKKHGDRTKLIVSHHDFNGTPSESKLQNIFNECAGRGAHIVKIVTFANSSEDNLKILKLISYAKKTNRKIIAFCMGEKGKISRIMAPYLGSYLSFASLEREAESAPGQLTVEEMREIFRILKDEK
ncbi:MAG: type I 3-dehydroquinate dehydratase [Deltaproteobacteria bacterium]|nr:type I 3-dehydroquinate dehydratase [Deltaproteobacteria bacterium]